MESSTPPAGARARARAGVHARGAVDGFRAERRLALGSPPGHPERHGVAASRSAIASVLPHVDPRRGRNDAEGEPGAKTAVEGERAKYARRRGDARRLAQEGADVPARARVRARTGNDLFPFETRFLLSAGLEPPRLLMVHRRLRV